MSGSATVSSLPDGHSVRPYETVLSALQALADAFGVHAAHGTVPRIDNPALVSACEILYGK